jgi:hypothetical protein
MANKIKLLTGFAAVLVLFLVPVVMASESVTTTAHFNIPSVVSFEVTLPGESAVESTGGGAATTDIEFNCTDSGGTEDDVEAKVVGGVVQNSTVPIYSINNIGTENLNVTISLNSAMPACMTLNGGTTHATASTSLGTGATTIVNDFTPATAAQDYFLLTNFDGCSSADATTRTITITGTQS